VADERQRGGRVTGVLSEVVDRRAGLITVSGHLTSSGADLVRGTADQLRDDGHARVVLDLRGVSAADVDGLAVLRELHHEFRVDGGELLIRS
jgi:anti-anti-sigma regulatory factor